MTRILSQAWREEHVRAGDDALDRAGIDRQPAAVVQALAAVAQAHYAAANVRAKEATVPQVVPYPGGELT